jgi:uncharacterized membrane protein
MNEFKSDISGKEFPISERISGKNLRQSILKTIQEQYPNFKSDGYLATSELNEFREKYISNYLHEQIGELSLLEKTVVESLTNRTTLADKVDAEDGKKLTFGQKIADKVATFGGSWTFIISFAIFILIWIMANVYWLMNKGFDPYPFILLNLILSCLAALQAPVIMMSQNRQEEKDRERARNDYMINLKAELEIRILHEKIDHLLMQQQPELLEMQKVQIEMMNDMIREFERSKTKD